MSYQISSAAFDDPDMPDMLRILSNYFQSQGIDFYIVGAVARDIVLGIIHNRNTRRKTKDLDIAIMIRDWGVFEEINSSLCRLPDFTKSSRQKQRFHYKDRLILDVIPFGEIAQADRNIYWPPDETPVMSVSGFVEMASEALAVVIDDEFKIGVASLPGIFVLKLIAWQDRYKMTNKDADDLAYLIDEYFEINLNRIAEAHPDIFDKESFTTFIAGGILMARDVKRILAGNEKLLHELTRIADEQISQAETSPLIGQILETHRTKKYDEVLQSLILLRQEMKK